MLIKKIQYSKNGKENNIEYKTYYSREENDNVSHIYFNDEISLVTTIYYRGDRIKEIVVSYNPYKYIIIDSYNELVEKTGDISPYKYAIIDKENELEKVGDMNFETFYEYVIKNYVKKKELIGY